MKLVKIIVFSLFLTFLFPAFVFAAQQTAGEITTMSTSWGEIQMTRQECLRRAETAIKEGGFSKGLEIVDNSSVFGDRGAYIASVRCIEVKQITIVFFVVAGPSGDRVGQYRGEIERNF